MMLLVLALAGGGERDAKQSVASSTRQEPATVATAALVEAGDPADGDATNPAGDVAEGELDAGAVVQEGPPAVQGLDLPEAVAPVPAPTVDAAAVGAAIRGWATHYGESYEGQPLGCPSYGVYRSADPTIVAVGPERYQEWPCGTRLRVAGPAGSAIVTRKDACPGCAANVLDLSEGANRLVCGVPEHTCRVEIEVVE